MVNKWVKYWLLLGLVMIFIQVIVGGITRLTESGLSITKWEIISGTLPPLSDDAWQKEFTAYQGTPQYEEINEGMSLGEFKFIYFWEWIHRFWARWMGFVFIIPFLFFIFKSYLDLRTIKNLVVVILLAVLAASFGWIMVKSGLVKRPWVNAYKLSLHLCIAFSVYAYLLYTFMVYIFGHRKKSDNGHHKYFSKLMLGFTIVLWLQLFFGGVMSGMKAGVYFPTWPDMNGEYFPQLIFNSGEWNVENFNEYDSHEFVPTLIQFIHRCTAYILFLWGIYFLYKVWKSTIGLRERRTISVFGFLLITQVFLGIITVLLCKGEVPVLWGVLHQGGALCLLSAAMWIRFKINLE